MKKKSVAVIGSGVGGLGAAIRLAVAGFAVTVFERNDRPGGKINNLQLGEYRFDMGPSVFTGPEYIKELYELCGEDFTSFEYEALPHSFNYFFSDGTQMAIHLEREKLLTEFENKLGERQQDIEKYLNKCEKNYNLIRPLFIENSLHKFTPFKNKKILPALANLSSYKLNQTMHEENSNTFSNKNTVQLFNRFATYNGSDPYQAPAMLNMIQHLELTVGVFLPKNGMVQIANSLYDLAVKKGVQFQFNEEVFSITQKNNKVTGLTTSKKTYAFNAIVSNMDVSFTYDQIQPPVKLPTKILNQEKSSSAMVFYWGVNRSFPELAIHNMFFAADYKEEFDCIFQSKTLSNDPSIYIHITSKRIEEDAPKGKENWFVMINTPIDIGQDWEAYRTQAKNSIINRLNKVLNCNLNDLIEEEFVMDAPFIAEKYNGKMGSIYGNASNNKFAAFYRHPNFSKTLKGLYFVGVTVHPGGGIPLALNSAKIAVKQLVKELKV